jgi:hypothetical protein
MIELPELKAALAQRGIPVRLPGPVPSPDEVAAWVA